MTETQENPIMRRGIIDLKKQLGRVSKYAVLVAPLTVKDIDIIYRALFKDYTEEDMIFLGNLTSAATKKTPLLILMTLNQRVESAQFIHFSTVIDYHDENKLKHGCHFSLNCLKENYRFKTKTSISYQEWSHSIENAVRMTKGQQLELEPDFSAYYEQQRKRLSFFEERNQISNTPSISDSCVEKESILDKAGNKVMKSVSWKVVEVIDGVMGRKASVSEKAPKN